RPYHLIRSLLRRGHSVTVAALWTSAAERADLDRLEAEGVQLLARRLPAWRTIGNCLGALPGPAPLQAVYSWEPALARDLRQALRSEDFDVLHIEHLRGARYGLEAVHQLTCQADRASPGRGERRLPVIWDSVDCISHLFAQASRDSRAVKSRIITR